MEQLSAGFEAHREHLTGVAQGLLGSTAEADDVVQEAWLRLHAHRQERDGSHIANLGGWLTTVVTRLCLDQLRRRNRRRELPLNEAACELVGSLDPAAEAERTEQVGAALLNILETLSPAERVCFVLHDLFGVSFDELSSSLGRSPAAVRQLASRGRRRVRYPKTSPEADRTGQRIIVESFLAASRAGDLTALLELLDPGAVIRADGAAVAMGAQPVVSQAAAVAATFSGRARRARLTDLDGYAAAAWFAGGRPNVVFGFVVDGTRITEIELIADPLVIELLDLAQPTARTQ